MHVHSLISNLALEENHEIHVHRLIVHVHVPYLPD